MPFLSLKVGCLNFPMIPVKNPTYGNPINLLKRAAKPSECGQQRTLNIVHAQTAAQQQSNGSYEARMSGKCGKWRD